MNNQSGIAAVLSLIAPGIGQIYNGDFIRGIFWLVITPGFWIGSGGTLGWICHVVSAWTAYRRGEYKQMLNEQRDAHRSAPTTEVRPKSM